MKRVHLIISGDVQGVGFRAWARELAQGKLVGWIKNTGDGPVEIVVEGSRRTLEDFIAACQHGPEVAWVEKVDVEWLPATGEFVNFSVVY